MENMRKDWSAKLAGTLFLAILSAGLLLFPLLLLPVRPLIFKSQSARIHELELTSDKLQRMVFTVEEFSQLNFIRPEREFVYRGNQYDVYSIQESGDRVIVLALWDSVETRFLETFQVQQNTDGTSVPAFGNMSFMPYFQVGLFSPDLPSGSAEIYPGKYLSVLYSNPYPGIGSPPPELLTAI